ncbi:MAG: hypothetical protein AB2A00_30580 [Myxococcota bacterium]
MAAKRQRNGGERVFPAEAFKLFRQMRDSLKHLEEGQVALAKAQHETTKVMVGLNAKVDRLAADLKAGLSRAEIRRMAPARPRRPT